MRPLPKSKQIKKALTASVTEFLSHNESVPFRCIIGNLEISLVKSVHAQIEAVTPGLFSDQNSGGWVEEIYHKEIQQCINEKSLKVTKNAKTNYPRWALILVDTIGFFKQSDNLKECPFDIKQFESVTIISTDSKRLLVIDQSTF